MIPTSGRVQLLTIILVILTLLTLACGEKGQGIRETAAELLEEARRIEENVREMFEKSQSMLPAPEGYDVSQQGGDPMIG